MPTTKPFIEPDWPAPACVFSLCTTRRGGHSPAPYDSLNLAHHVGDDDTLVGLNREILTAALPAGAGVQWLSQVHGVEVVEANSGGYCPQADASWSRQAGTACTVMTADCLPVLFCTTRGDRVAAAHAGWRGLLDGVLEATVAVLAEEPGQILVWLGPAIGPGAFEVGVEVREGFLAAATAAESATVEGCFIPNSANPGHFFADLYALARLRLRRCGVEAVYGGGFCTFTDSERFYSYRRDGHTGRMASVVLIRPSFLPT